MYRIRLTNGAERTLATSEAFTAAVRDGTVTADCSIHHQRADKWLPIASHPHFQRALSAPPPRPSGPVPQPSAIDAGDLDRTLELLDHLPAPESARAVAPSDLPFINDGADELHGDRPSGLDGLVSLEAPAPTLGFESAAESIAPVVESPVVEAPVVEAPEPPTRLRPRSRDLEFVYVPESPARRATPPAATTEVPPARATPEPVREVEPAPAPVVVVRAEPVTERSAEPDAEPDAGPELETVVAPEAAPVAAPMAATLDAFALDELEALETPEPREPRDSRPARSIDLSPLDDPGAGRRRATMFGTAALLAVGITLAAWRPWHGTTVAQAAEPAVTPAVQAAATAPVATAPVATETTVSGGSATGFGGTDANTGRHAAAPAAAATPAADSVDVAAPAVTAPSVDLGAIAATGVGTGVGTGAGGALPISRATMARNYAAASLAARTELQTQLAAAGVARLFDRDRLGSLDGVLAARRAVSEAGKALKQYRTRQTAIEQAYGDTLALVGRRLGLTGGDLAAWDVRVGQRESADDARLADQMLAQLDRVLGLLVGEDGRYRLAADGIAFDDSTAAARYGELQAWLEQKGTSGAPTLQQLVRAMGGVRLPDVRP